MPVVVPGSCWGGALFGWLNAVSIMPLLILNTLSKDVIVRRQNSIWRSRSGFRFDLVLIPEMESPLTFVLVHGAWHGGWCWRVVADLLRKGGHLVFTPTLTGFGERVHLTRPDLTLEDFATDIVNVITAEELSNIILVGHSFGGNPVSVVADRVPELLKQLVYLDTLLLKNGESGFSQLDSAIVAQRIELAEKTSGGLTIPPPSPDVFGVVDPADAEWLRRRLTPLPLNCYQVPIRLGHPLGNGLSKTYIACTNPVYQPAVRTHEWVKRQTDWQYLELATGHDAMVTSPNELAAMLVNSQ